MQCQSRNRPGARSRRDPRECQKSSDRKAGAGTCTVEGKRIGYPRNQHHDSEANSREETERRERTDRGRGRGLRRGLELERPWLLRKGSTRRGETAGRSVGGRGGAYAWLRMAELVIATLVPLVAVGASGRAKHIRLNMTSVTVWEITILN